LIKNNDNWDKSVNKNISNEGEIFPHAKKISIPFVPIDVVNNGGEKRVQMVKQDTVIKRRAKNNRSREKYSGKAKNRKSEFVLKRGKGRERKRV
jgi:hypothetical protein